jgi:hypothetical protein
MSKYKLNIKSKRPIVFSLLTGVAIGFFVSKFIQHKNALDNNIFGEPLFELDGKVWSSQILPQNLLFDYYGFEKNIYDAKRDYILKAALRIGLSQDSGKMQELPPLQNLIATGPIDDVLAKNYYDSVVRTNGIAMCPPNKCILQTQ